VGDEVKLTMQRARRSSPVARRSIAGFVRFAAATRPGAQPGKPGANDGRRATGDEQRDYL